MARSHAASHRNRHVPALGRACVTVAALVAVLSVLALPVIAGSAASGARAALDARRAASPPLAVTVTSVSPSYAAPGQKITIKGRLWNGTASTMRDLSVSLLSSTAPIPNDTDLQEFAGGTLQLSEVPVSVSPLSVGHLRSRHSVAWSIRVPVSDLRLDCFGVYPLTVFASNAAQSRTSSDPVPLPFWPGKAAICPGALRPSPFPITWVWPLIDSPHAGPCPGLLDNTLAASIGTGGRLANLLDVGRNYAASAKLTWAIDPALLDNVRTMTKPYQVGSSASCLGATSHPADGGAKSWLSDVVSATTGQTVFVTPYADVDVAGLAQFGNNADLKKAFTDGEHLAGPMLRRNTNPAQVPASPRRLSAIAWPAGGLANSEVLENLGAMDIGTVILAMPALPPTSSLTFTPGAVTSQFDGVGTKLKVLLANGLLSSLLASKATSSTSPGTIFNVSQLYLADTAMFAGQAPAMKRPILVTPPRRWDPSTTLASDLLADTVSAPWLAPSSIGQLAAQPEEHYYSSVLTPPGRDSELPGSLLRKVSALDTKVTLLQSIMNPKDPQLSRAVFGIESSRWVGQAAPQAGRMLTRTARFVHGQFAGLSIGGRQTIHVTLGGRVGTVTVSIRNLLNYPVSVGLRVRSSNDTVAVTQKVANEVYVVPAHSSIEPKLSVNAAQTGKATVTLSLRAPNGTLLPDPPDKPLTLEISATNLGTVALVICAAALAIFVFASAAQAIRRGRPTPGPAAAGAEAGEGGDAGDAAAAADHRDSPTDPVPADNVDSDNPDAGRSELSTAGPGPASLPTEESR
ncbi:MAG TPA: DUF6049 family protein [Streptosporangiaceae bacterium]|nr:DUF6049 family protein [Streptosporangiaceae bacterium]